MQTNFEMRVLIFNYSKFAISLTVQTIVKKKIFAKDNPSHKTQCLKISPKKCLIFTPQIENLDFNVDFWRENSNILCLSEHVVK